MEIVEQLEQLKDRWVPQTTAYYSPISHYDYAAELINHLEHRNCGVEYTRFHLMPGTVDEEKRPDAVMFAWIGITYPDMENENLLYKYGAINSHDRTHAVKLFGGSDLFMCANGMIWGQEFTLNQKHSGEGILRSVRSMIEAGYTHVQLQHKKMDDAIELMSNIGLSRERAAELVIDAMSNGSIAPSAVEPVWDHYEMREEAGEKFPERNMWSLYNAFTEKYKGEKINNVYRKNRKLNEFITNTPEYLEAE